MRFTVETARRVLAGLMIAIGIAHFATPAPFIRLVPKMLPAPHLLVAISGFFEILGGIGLLVPQVRRAAGIGLILLYLAVFPANINQAVNQIQFTPDGQAPSWFFWLRLPVQALFIAWAYWVSRPNHSFAPSSPRV